MALSSLHGDGHSPKHGSSMQHSPQSSPAHGSPTLGTGQGLGLLPLLPKPQRQGALGRGRDRGRGFARTHAGAPLASSSRAPGHSLLLATGPELLDMHQLQKKCLDWTLMLVREGNMDARAVHMHSHVLPEARRGMGRQGRGVSGWCSLCPGTSPDTPWAGRAWGSAHVTATWDTAQALL